MNNLLLNNMQVVLPDGSRENASVLVVGDKISSIVEAGVEVRADTKIDLTKHKLFPGFIDVHNHGSVGIDIMDAQPDTLGDVSRYLASQGVTSWLPTLVPSSDDNYGRVAQAIEVGMQTSSRGARILGIHYEGPFVNSAQCGALHTNYFKAYSGPS